MWTTMAKNCTALAALLSSHYLSTTPYDDNTNQHKKQPLNRYLSNNGVLLTMCLDNFCSLLPGDNLHISASWVNMEMGFQTIFNSSIGYILDPDETNIQCLYPTDGATLSRDGNGCGAMAMDPDHGSQGYAKSGTVRRWTMKYGLEQYLKFNYGNLDSSEIPCEYVLKLGPWNDVFSYWKRNDDGRADGDEIDYVQNPWAEFSKQFAPFLRRPICNTGEEDAGSAVDDISTGPLIYIGAESWKPSEWQLMIDTMHNIMAQYPHKKIWNEIVIQPPTRMKDIVSAVFYVVSSDMNDSSRARLHSYATMQAKVLGKDVTVLVVDQTDADNGWPPLFRCALDQEDDDGSATTTSLY